MAADQRRTATTRPGTTRTGSTNAAADRAAARAAAKFEARRAELASLATVTLAEQGYANTSLRDIAAACDFSHGVLHYYFQDKLDLVAYCVRQYKAVCMQRYDGLLNRFATSAELIEGFVELLETTVVEDALMHRLWYDLRAQSLFEERLRGPALEIDAALERMIWRIVDSAARLSGTTPTVAPAIAYAGMDGLFQRALLRSLAGETEAAVCDLKAGAVRLLDFILERSQRTSV